MLVRSVIATIALNLVAGSNAFGLDRETIESAYAHIYSHLESYRVVYVRESRRYGSNLSLVQSQTRRYEWYRDSARFGYREFIDEQQGVIEWRKRYWRVADFETGTTRRLGYSSRNGTTPIKGERRSLTDQQLYSFGDWSYLALIGLHNARPTPNTRKFIPSTATTDVLSLLSLPEVIISKDTETIDGYPCYSITWRGRFRDPIFRAWLASDMNFALVRRETYGSPTTGEISPIIVVECKSFYEPKPGIFLPKNVRVHMPEGEFPQSLGGEQLSVTDEYRLIEIAFNPKIPEAEFDLVIPPGVAVQTDPVHGILGEIGNFVGEAVDVYTLGAAGASSTADAETRSRPYRLLVQMSSLGVVAAVCWIVIFYWRRNRKLRKE